MTSTVASWPRLPWNWPVQMPTTKPFRSTCTQSTKPRVVQIAARSDVPRDELRKLSSASVRRHLRELRVIRKADIEPGDVAIFVHTYQQNVSHDKPPGCSQIIYVRNHASNKKPRRMPKTAQAIRRVDFSYPDSVMEARSTPQGARNFTLYKALCYANLVVKIGEAEFERKYVIPRNADSRRAASSTSTLSNPVDESLGFAPAPA